MQETVPKKARLDSLLQIFSGKTIMPYEIKRKGAGFAVCDAKRCFSKKPLTLATAKKQRIAIALSESSKTGKPVSKYFA